MVAYLFWHRPDPEVTTREYEAVLRAFHAGLTETAPPGVVASATYRIDEVPWLHGLAGYEDWYILEGLPALEALAEHKGRGWARTVPEAIAGRSATGLGGLYRLVAGKATPVEHSTVWWLTRPRGARCGPILQELCARLGNEATAWRRLFALGPAPEFAVVNRSRFAPALPPDWKGIPVAHHALPKWGS